MLTVEQLRVEQIIRQKLQAAVVLETIAELKP
jgi:hypothetical protein